MKTRNDINSAFLVDESENDFYLCSALSNGVGHEMEALNFTSGDLEENGGGKIAEFCCSSFRN